MNFRTNDLTLHAVLRQEGAIALPEVEVLANLGRRWCRRYRGGMVEFRAEYGVGRDNVPVEFTVHLDGYR